MKPALQIETFFHNRHQYVHGDGNPNLGSDRIFRGAVKGFDPQMLLDPPKEKFHLPATPIELSNRESGQEKIVGEKDQPLFARNIVVTHSAKAFGIAAFGYGIVERDDLIALQAGLFVHRLGVQAPAVEAFFGAGHEESSTLMHAVQSSKIEIATIHQVNGSGLPNQLIEDVDLVDLSTRDDDHGGNTASKIEKGVKLDGRFVSAELSPGKK